MRPYYEDDFVTLYHGDCRDLLPGLAVVGAVVTDPPYNLGIEYSEHADDMEADAYEAFTRQWWGLLPERDRTVVFPGLSNLPMWCRIDTPTAVGCWYAPGNPGRGFPWSFVEWEPVLYWGGFLGGSNVLRFPVSKQRGVGDHPCPKPLGLMRAVVARTKAETVLDPFAGSGSTLRAAKDCGVTAIGIELDERYCEIAARRLSQEVLDFGGAA